MFDKGWAHTESFPTVVTLMWFVSSMDSLMLVKVWAHTKCFATLIAVINLLSIVDSVVQPGVSLHWRLSYTHCRYRASTQCAFFHVQWGLSPHGRLFHNGHTHTSFSPVGILQCQMRPELWANFFPYSLHLYCLSSIGLPSGFFNWSPNWNLFILRNLQYIC